VVVVSVMIVAVMLRDSPTNRARARSSSAPDDRIFQTVPKNRAQNRTPGRTDQRAFPRPDPAAVVMMALLILPRVTTVIPAPNLIVHAAVVVTAVSIYLIAISLVPIALRVAAGRKRQHPR
jgi:hypothetical protein